MCTDASYAHVTSWTSPSHEKQWSTTCAGDRRHFLGWRPGGVYMLYRAAPQPAPGRPPREEHCIVSWLLAPQHSCSAAASRTPFVAERAASPRSHAERTHGSWKFIASRFEMNNYAPEIQYMELLREEQDEKIISTGLSSKTLCWASIGGPFFVNLL